MREGPQGWPASKAPPTSQHGGPGPHRPQGTSPGSQPGRPPAQLMSEPRRTGEGPGAKAALQSESFQEQLCKLFCRTDILPKAEKCLLLSVPFPPVAHGDRHMGVWRDAPPFVGGSELPRVKRDSRKEESHLPQRIYTFQKVLTGESPRDLGGQVPWLSTSDQTHQARGSGRDFMGPVLASGSPQALERTLDGDAVSQVRWVQRDTGRALPPESHH